MKGRTGKRGAGKAAAPARTKRRSFPKSGRTLPAGSSNPAEGVAYEVLSAGEMQGKYGLFAQNARRPTLNPSRVPRQLLQLIPMAEFWGIGDDLIREDVVTKAPVEALEALRVAVRANRATLNEWLAGPEADPSQPSPEYLAFSNMRMAADSA